MAMGIAMTMVQSTKHEKIERVLTSSCHRFAITKSIQVDTTRTQNPRIYARITFGSLGK
jgi:hypothetical protein